MADGFGLDESSIDGLDEEKFMNELYLFATENKEPPKQSRKVCNRCSRPLTVCWCPYLAAERIQISTDVFILQHPFEELRKLKTAPMLYQSVQEGKCHIIRGKKFNNNKRCVRYPDLHEVLSSPDTLLLFPGEDAVDIRQLVGEPNTSYNLVVLDGTWSQARGMYANNKLLQLPRKVKVETDMTSRYVIRTQPTDTALSTLESVAVALSILENRPELVETLVAPLEALCRFQLHHGAVAHQSREYKIAHGLWNKTLPRKLIRRMQRQDAENALTRDSGEHNRVDDPIRKKEDENTLKMQLTSTKTCDADQGNLTPSMDNLEEFSESQISTTCDIIPSCDSKPSDTMDRNSTYCDTSLKEALNGTENIDMKCDRTVDS
ncbi:tRNA-uridine aminocarboxypropyltransferase 2-like [Mya arenaria]|uniref:tRNA-uridine aminocarboxypropyltransferase 2-like n=1 Tax=Mya arenaria TaxID=6604 RepID=UPI0022E3C1C1|nr:tRNA-uridine aminocarboxypropyltransferase 2-like [Mya arenaria]